MTRKNLLAELENCAAWHGLKFRTGPVHGINARLQEPPEVWTEGPVLLKRIGRSEGTKTYRVVLRLVDVTSPEKTAEESIDEMERTLSAMVVSLCRNEDIAGIPSVEYVTEENTLTNRGDVSVKATLTIQTRF